MTGNKGSIVQWAQGLSKKLARSGCRFRLMSLGLPFILFTLQFQSVYSVNSTRATGTGTGTTPGDAKESTAAGGGIPLMVVAVLVLLVTVGKLVMDLQMGGGSNSGKGAADPNPMTIEDAQAVMDVWTGLAGKSLYMAKAAK